MSERVEAIRCECGLLKQPGGPCLRCRANRGTNVRGRSRVELDARERSHKSAATARRRLRLLDAAKKVAAAGDRGLVRRAVEAALGIGPK